MLLSAAVIQTLQEALLHPANILLIYCAVIGAISLSTCSLCRIWTQVAPIRLTRSHKEGLEGHSFKT